MDKIREKVRLQSISINTKGIYRRYSAAMRRLELVSLCLNRPAEDVYKAAELLAEVEDITTEQAVVELLNKLTKGRDNGNF